MNQHLTSCKNKLIEEKNNIINDFANIPYDLTQKKYRYASKKINKIKNNFCDILPSEETSVKLKKINNDEYSDYINANWIFDKYIATQQPNTHTINDFWRMIFDTKTKLIINLNGDDNYLPKKISILINREERFDKLYIKIVDIITKKNIIIRKMVIRNDIQYHYFHQITFYAWPDRNIPDISNFKRLYNITNNLIKKYEQESDINSPTVVHCLAGVGRTGTFILIDYVLSMLSQRKKPNIIDIIKQMRKNREQMVQGKLQLNFALDFIIEYIEKMIVDNDNLIKSADDLLKNSINLDIVNNNNLAKSTEINCCS